MKKTFTSMVFLLLATTVLAQTGFEHADPPPGDPDLTNRFGRSWSEPIYVGYLIVEGEYIGAPYIVEQRGYRTMVNGKQVDAVDGRLVLPFPPPPPVTEDPGMPKDLTKDTLLNDTFGNPVLQAKRRYWDHIGLSDEKRTQAEIDYLSSFPNVSKVEDTGESAPLNQRLIKVWDKKNQMTETFIPVKARVPPGKIPDETIDGWILSSKGGVERDLKNGVLIFEKNGGIIAQMGQPDSSPRWQEVFETMAGNLTPEEKVAKLKQLAFLNASDTPKIADHTFAINHFKPTDQLWKRLKGDVSWKNGADARLLALTNGWQYIVPQSVRGKASATVAPVTNKPAVSQIEIATTPMTPKQAKSSESRSVQCAYPILIATVSILLLVVLAIMIKRRS